MSHMVRVEIDTDERYPDYMVKRLEPGEHARGWAEEVEVPEYVVDHFEQTQRAYGIASELIQGYYEQATKRKD